jgi:hypothetical protein
MTVLPAGVISAPAACRLVVDRPRPGFFTGVEEVHLVLTTYAKGVPVESGGGTGSSKNPSALVWVVEVHGKAINWNHSVLRGYTPPKLPYTDFSVVMNARTGRVSGRGECRCWPLPLSTVGTFLNLPPDC